MIRSVLAILAAACFAAPAAAAVQPFPASFKTQDVRLDGVTLHVRVGGHGPAVLMLHGFGDSGDMWAPLAAVMVADHTVIVPDLRGMGLSSHPDHGYDKKSQGADMLRLLDRLQVRRFDLVTHDIGNMVGYALAAQQPDRVTRWVVMDAPLPGLGHWDDQLKNPKTWHFNFHGPDEERLVKGRERIFLDRFYNELSADPKRIDVATRRHYAVLYARPHAMHDALEQFVAFPADGVDNQAFVARGKLTMPVLAIGGSASYGASLATEIGFAAANVKSAVVQNSGHWLMEEQPAATVAAITGFLAAP
ncbi:alpha/beta fold hydrolase [Phenylobacterium sp.]|uniref:alpha/beta fold hydrolase n=1 Tax=Phenylobacterium sp. TaxID=1871053 RepID=UPI003562B2E5